MHFFIFTEDTLSVSDLKQNPQVILDGMHANGRPVLITDNCKAESVLLNISAFEKLLQVSKLATLLKPAEINGNTKKASDPEQEWRL